jgi:hypothetical protein
MKRIYALIAVAVAAAAASNSWLPVMAGLTATAVD